MKDLDFIDNLLPNMKDEDLKKLAEKARKMKMDVLFEEPCPIYESNEEDWEDFWYNEDK